GGERQARAGTKLLRRSADVDGDVARLEVRAVIADGHVHLRKPKFADSPQCVGQRRRAETECGTGNEHGNLRRVLARSSAQPVSRNIFAEGRPYTVEPAVMQVQILR